MASARGFEDQRPVEHLPEQLLTASSLSEAVPNDQVPLRKPTGYHNSIAIHMRQPVTSNRLDVAVSNPCQAATTALA